MMFKLGGAGEIVGLGLQAAGMFAGVVEVVLHSITPIIELNMRLILVLCRVH